MSASEDITNLFRKFGGEPEHYQELSRDNAAQESRARWPLLSSVHLAGNALAPSVKDGVLPVSGAPVPNLQGHAPVQATVSPFAAQVASMRAPEPQAGTAAHGGAASLAKGGSRTNGVGSVGNTLFKTRAAVRAERQSGHQNGLRSELQSDSGGARHATGVGGLGGQGDIRRGIQTNRLAAQVSSAPDTALHFEPHLSDEEGERGVPPLADHADGARDLDGERLPPSNRPATLGQTMRRFAQGDGHAEGTRSTSGQRAVAGTSVSAALNRSIKRAPMQTPLARPSRQIQRVAHPTVEQLPTEAATHIAQQQHGAPMPDAAHANGTTAPRSLSSVFSRLAGPSPEAAPVAEAPEVPEAPVPRNPLFARLSRL